MRESWGRGSVAALALLLWAAPALANVEAAQPRDECVAPAAPGAPVTPAFGEQALPALRAADEARAALEAGRLEGLARRLAEARETVEAVAEPAARAHLLIHLGRTSASLAERPAGGPALARRAAELFQSAAEAAAQANDERLRSYALGYLGELYERDGRVEEALALTRRALFTAQTASAPDALYRWQWQLARLYRAAGQDELALLWYRQTVATLAEIREQRTLGAGGGGSAFRAEVEPIYTGLVDLLLLRAARDEHRDEEQALLAEARSAIEDWQARELRDYFRDACLDAQRKAAPDVIPGAVVVYPIPLPGRLELIVSDEGTLHRYVAPVGRERLVAEVRAFRHTLEKRTTRQYLRPARQLYDWLIRPLEPSLADRERPLDTLVFVPGGALRTIPLAALNDRESRKFLIEKYPLAITPGLTLTEPRAIDRSRVQALAAGISEPVQGFPALENVGREIEVLSRAFPGEKLMNEQFVVARFENDLAGQPFGIVHVASHGEFAADVSQSFLLAYDGKLSIDRLAALVAKTRFREQQPLELLALSACETAAGDDRAALGLAGVALRAGARSALATLWSVNDEASSDLVGEFYTQLANPELSRAQALQRAQVKLLSTYSYRHPSYWSPFLLISSWL